MEFQIFASLPASDLARAEGWYRQFLGIEPSDRTEEGSLLYEVGGSAFLVYASQYAGTNQATAAALAVKDFDTAIAELRARGVVFEDYDFGDEFRTVDGVATSPGGNKAAWFRDSEGNILGIGTDPRS
jgi:catechol 2,3-dioxygenase-like lactoylglutathione lyase family enzyme